MFTIERASGFVGKLGSSSSLTKLTNAITNDEKVEYENEMNDYITNLMDTATKDSDNRLTIICLFNGKSGTRKAQEICSEFSKYNVKLFEVKSVATNEAVQLEFGTILYKKMNKVFNNSENKCECIVAICGGDGTYSWVINQLIEKCIHKTKLKFNINMTDDSISYPHVCFVPSGTGNDLARTLGWGFVTLEPKKCFNFISDIHFCSQIAKRYAKLDRWSVNIKYLNDSNTVSNSNSKNGSSITYNTNSDKSSENGSKNGIEKNEKTIDNSNSNENKNNSNDTNSDYNYSSVESALNAESSMYTLSHLTESKTEDNDSNSNSNSNDISTNSNDIVMTENSNTSNNSANDNSDGKKQKQHHRKLDLPPSFVSYLSVGYDAMVTYVWEQERNKYTNRFKSQAINNLIYIKNGFWEFMSQSEPINKQIRLTMDGKPVKLISSCRSCKFININNAMGGVFLWGDGKSYKNECQEWTYPQCCDGKIEVITTRGVRNDSFNKCGFSHAHRVGQSREIKLEILKTPLALQIDGEAWIIEEPMEIDVKLRDQIPVIVGCNQPNASGVGNKIYEKTLHQSSRNRFASKFRQIYETNDATVDPNENVANSGGIIEMSTHNISH